MPGVTHPPDQSRTLDSGIARTERIERQTRGHQGPAVAPPTIVFSYPGTLASSVVSPPWYPSQNMTILEVRVSGVVVSSDTDIALYRDTTPIDTYTLPSGTLSTVTFPTAINVDTGQSIVLITGTTAAVNVSVQLTVVPR